MVLKNRKPIFVNGGTHIGMVVFTNSAQAKHYASVCGGNIDIEKWDIAYFIDILSSIIEIMDQRGIEWVIINHPATTGKNVTHLKARDILSLKIPGPFRVSFTVPSQG